MAHSAICAYTVEEFVAFDIPDVAILSSRKDYGDWEVVVAPVLEFKVNVVLGVV